VSISFNESPELEKYLPSNALKGYDYQSMENHSINLSRDGRSHTVDCDLVIFMHKQDPLPLTSHLNCFGTTTSFNLGHVGKKLPNDYIYPANSLEDVHNVAMNTMGKMSSFSYPSVAAYRFNLKRPVFLLGDFKRFDTKIESKGI
jgi:hypothetical protein